MPRGRKAGSVVAGSYVSRLVALEPSERYYFETTLAQYHRHMRVAIPPTTRRPVILDGRTFTAKLFTAVSAGAAGDVRYLICVERKN